MAAPCGSFRLWGNSVITPHHFCLRMPSLIPLLGGVAQSAGVVKCNQWDAVGGVPYAYASPDVLPEFESSES